MYTYKLKKVSKTILLLCIIGFISRAGNSMAITIPELRELSSENFNNVNTAHLVYVEEYIDNRLPAGEANSLHDKLQKIDKHTIKKVDAIFDRPSLKLKTTTTDLRDLDTLLRDYNLPLEQKINITSSNRVLYENDYEMEFSDTATLGYNSVGLFKAPGPPEHTLKVLNFGIIDTKWLSEELSPTVREVENEKGKQSTEIRFVKENKDKAKIEGVIECDPATGYHFRSFQLFKNGKLIEETTADKYQIIDGAAYPFLYIDRLYDENGKVLIERRYNIESAKFKVDLSDNDFSLFIPAGTTIVDSVLAGDVHKLEQDSYMDIADILNIGSQTLADKMVRELEAMPSTDRTPAAYDLAIKNEETTRIFIPHIKLAKEKKQPFILDLDSKTFINIDEGDEVKGESLYRKLIKMNKGDIAWNGSLILLRESKIFASDGNSSGKFIYTTNKWCGSCELPEKVQLPCSLCVVNKKGAKYGVVIEKIKSDGILVALKKLNPRDIAEYDAVKE